MERMGRAAGQILAGLFVFAGYAAPQAYTISAKPGAVNYVEGVAYLNGNRLSEKANRATFLSANDTLSTEIGKAEVLLSPGVFLRIGDNSQIRMIAPSLVNAQVEVIRGEAMIEVSGLVKDNTVQVSDHGGSITIERNGLYRINGDNPPRIAVLDGKAAVAFGSRETSLAKGREIVLSDLFKTEKFDPKQPDDLYAWSNIRSEYDSAASYQAASNVGSNSFGGWGGYGFGGWSNPGWYWASGFDSWAWLPGAGAFYSPFGYGFYAPGAVAYAPVVVTPVYRGTGGVNGSGNHGPWNGHWTGRQGVTASVPVNPNRPAAVGSVAASPFANSAARAQVAQSFASNGFHTASGAPVAAFSGGHVSGFSGNGHVGVASSGGGHVAGGGWSGGGGGGHTGGGAAMAGGAGGHAGGGGGGHR